MTNREVRQRLDLPPTDGQIVRELGLYALKVLAVVTVVWGWAVVFLGLAP